MSAPELFRGAPRLLPRGPHGLSREVVEASQRRRVLDAVAEVVAESGYGAMTVADVVLRAGVSRKTFYAFFGDRQSCFLAAYEDGMQTLRAEMVQAITASLQQDAIGRLRASVRTYLGFLADRPTLARTFLLEVHAAGPAAVDRKALADEEYAVLTRRWHLAARREHPEYREVPDAAYVAVVGAAHALVRKQVRSGQGSQLRALEPMLMYIHLSLLTTAEAAEDALSESRHRALPLH